MIEAGAGTRGCGTWFEGGNAAVKAAAGFLHFAAAPTFAVMALLTGLAGGGPMDALCAAAGVSPLGGMMAMYLLMSAFHSAPWLKLAAERFTSRQ